MGDAQVFTLISHGETYGMVYIEAMLQGCLTIASNAERRRIAQMYTDGIKNTKVMIPFVPDDCVPVWHIYGIRCTQRDSLEKHLNDKGIGTNKHYPIPMHMQECYQDLNIPQGSLPIAEEISATELSIPMYYGMTDDEIRFVIDAINEF
jgi:dTDP-4-amino-4,6-dideoxygalactose transaminase